METVKWPIVHCLGMLLVFWLSKNSFNSYLQTQCFVPGSLDLSLFLSCVFLLLVGFQRISFAKWVIISWLCSWILGSISLYFLQFELVEVGLLFYFAGKDKAASPWTCILLLRLCSHSFFLVILSVVATDLLLFHNTEFPSRWGLSVFSSLAIGIMFTQSNPLPLLSLACYCIGAFTSNRDLVLFLLPLGLVCVGKMDAVVFQYAFMVLIVSLLRAFWPKKKKESISLMEESDIEYAVLVLLSRQLIMPFPGHFRFGNLLFLHSYLRFLFALVLVALCAFGLQRIFHSDPQHLWLFCVWIYLLPFFLAAHDTVFAVSAMLVLVFVLLVFPPISRTGVLGSSVLWIMAIVILSFWKTADAPSFSLFENVPQAMKEYCADHHDLFSLKWSSPFLQDTLWPNAVLTQTSAICNDVEPEFCRTNFPTNLSAGKSKHILVVGDSVGRFLFYALANLLSDDQFGNPKAKFHGDIQPSNLLHFHWAPFASDLLNATRRLSSSVDVLVISIGLWDKLWRRDPQVYQLEIETFLGQLLAVPGVSYQTQIVWVEMTPCVDDRLNGTKLEFLTENTAPLWRSKVEAAALMAQPPNWNLFPTVTLTKSRPSQDGVHYDLLTYRALATVLLRLVTWQG